MEADLPLPTHVRGLPRAAEWLKLQVALGRASNTVAAYGRGLDDFLCFCSGAGIDPERAGRAEIATYLRDMATRPPTRSRSAAGLANATLCQRLTIMRLFYEHLVEEGVRPTNPVGRSAAGRGRRAMIQSQRRLPWIPSEHDWNAIIEAARDEPSRNRLMLALAYDAALRREELCSLETGDFDPAHRTVTLRAETTKTKRARCLPYSAATGELFAAYLSERRTLSRSRGPLFLSASTRNRSVPIGKWSWSKIVHMLGQRAGVPNLTTHSFRHLCLTDLARAGWDAHEIAGFAGHRSLQSTLLYIHLSARDLAGKFALGMAAIHERRMALLLGRP